MNRFYLILIIACCFNLSCKKHEFSITNLSGNTIQALGKGGMGMADLYPMNSYESILKCLNMGADGVELDIQMTKDSVLVIFHDEDLAALGRSGRIHDFTWLDLQDAIYEGAPFTDYQIASLDTLFSKLDDPTQFIYSLDCKLFFDSSTTATDVYFTTLISALCRVAKRYELQQQLMIESYDVSFLAQFKATHINSIFYLSSHSFADALASAKDMQLDGILMSSEMISADEIAEAHANNLLVQVHSTNNRRQNVDAIEKNPDFIQANDIKSLINLLD